MATIKSHIILKDGTTVYFDSTNTPIDNFCASGDSITINGINYLKTNIVSVVFASEYSAVTTIGSNFLHTCYMLTSIDLSGLSNVTSIGDNFLHSCQRLTRIDLSPLSNVTSVGEFFLSGCIGLTSIDLNPLSNVTTIGLCFLNSCIALTSIDLNPLSNVTTIGSSFLSGCSYLTRIDLSPLSNVTTIGTYFLHYCSKLTSIDLSGLSKVTTIGSNFLSSCSKLTSIDLSGLSKVTTIGSDFLSRCIALTSIDLSGLSNVTSIGDNFLSGCSSLTSLDLNVLPKVITINKYFLLNCTGLTSIDLSPLSKVTTIGLGFLSGCSKLTSITIGSLVFPNNIFPNTADNFRNIPNVNTSLIIANKGSTALKFKQLIAPSLSLWKVKSTSTEKESHAVLKDGSIVYFEPTATPINNFCNANTSIIINGKSYSKTDIVSFVFVSEYSAVTDIGSNFLQYCSSLTSIDLSGLSKVTQVGSNFLQYCSSLTSIDLSPLSNVTSIGKYFLYNCSSLTSIDLNPLSRVTSVFEYFLLSCSSLTSIDLNPLSRVTRVGDCFLLDCSSLTSIDLSPLSNVTSIGSSFLHNCSSLTSIDLSSLSKVTTIGSSFLHICQNLTSIDLSSLSKVKIIGSDFLRDCTGLTSITIGDVIFQNNIFPNTSNNFANIPNVTTSKIFANKGSIGQNFKKVIAPKLSLWGVKSTSTEKESHAVLKDGSIVYFELTNTPIVNFCVLSSEPNVLLNGVLYPKTDIVTIVFEKDFLGVDTIGNGFLTGFSSLTKLDLTGLSNTFAIGNDFCLNCTDLISIDLSSLAKVTSIDNKFCYNCLKLESLDLKAAKFLLTIGDDFCLDCSSLKSVDLTGLVRLFSIGAGFCHKCYNLTNIGLTGLTKLSLIGDNCLSGCSKLLEIDLSDLMDLTSIGDYFCAQDKLLSKVNLSEVSSLKSIGNNFLDGCTSLVAINLSRVTKLSTIGDNFLNDCSNLSVLNLTSLTSLISIGNNFGNNCISFTRISLSSSRKLSSIGDNFLQGCSKLSGIDLSELAGINSIGIGFCSDCITLKSIMIGDVLPDTLFVDVTQCLANVPNVNTSNFYGTKVSIANAFKQSITPMLSKWGTKTDSWVKPALMKIFKSLDLRDNFIYNVRVTDPVIGENPVNKRTLITTTTYDTDRAKRFTIPFKFPWLTERLYGLRFKKVFDELFYPIIPYKYTNPKLDKIDFVSFITNNGYNNLIDLGNNEPNGAKPKHQLFYDTNNFAFKLNFGINKHERLLAGPARLKIYDLNDNLVGNFGAVNTNDSGVIEVTNQIFKPGYKIIFEKQYNASVVCENTHREPSPEDGFTNVGYLYREDITAEFYNRFYLIHTPVIRLKTGTDALATDVVSGNNPPAGFTYNYSYQVNTGAECLFDILIPNELAASIKPLEYNMEINIRLSPNTGNPYNKVLYTQKLGDLYNQLHMAGDTIYTIGGVKYRLGYINLGTFEKHPVRIDFILKPY